MLAKTAAQLVQEAKARVANLTPAEVAAELQSGAVTLIDIREAHERENGCIPGAVHASRGMLEFYADPGSPYHRAEFHPERRIILHCASGGRSALAVCALAEMGYSNLAHLDGGLKAWEAAGHPVEKPGL